MTQIANTQKATMREVESGASDAASWHARFAHSAYVYAGGLPFTLTEGDVLCVFSQFGEIVDVNLVRHEESGKSRGFAFVCYADQRSTTLAVDNLNGATVGGRTIRVDHVDDYRLKNEDDASRKEWRCACGQENFKWRDVCFKCSGPRPVAKRDAEAEEAEERRERAEAREVRVQDSGDVVDAAGPRSTKTDDEDERIIRELQARKAAAIARAEAAAKGLPIPGEDEDRRDSKRHKKEKKDKKDKKDKRDRDRWRDDE